MRNDGFIVTYTGRHVNPLRMTAADVDICDIAHALSNTCRFTGHVSRFYSVAQHACVVHDALAKGLRPQKGYWAAKLYALHHDDSEAYLCDVARPVKQMAQMVAYRNAEAVLEHTIAVALSLDTYWHEVVKRYDEIALVTEARDLMHFDSSWNHWSMRDQALPRPIIPWTPRRAEREFLKRHYKLTGVQP